MTNYKFNSDNTPFDLSTLPITLADGLKRYANIIDAVSIETETDLGNGETFNDGYWIFFSDGFIDPDFEIHMIHEYTIADCLERLPHIVRCTEHNCIYADHHAITAKHTCSNEINAINNSVLLKTFPQLATLESAIAYANDTLEAIEENKMNNNSRVISGTLESASNYLQFIDTIPNFQTPCSTVETHAAPCKREITIPQNSKAKRVKGIKRNRKSPITTIYNGSGVVPHRIVINRVVKRFVMTAMDRSWGIRYGKIKLDGSTVIVKSLMRDNGQWSQWELLSL